MMTLSRKRQAIFANTLLPVVEHASDDPKQLDNIHKVCMIIVEYADKDSNGIAFDLAEYTYELKGLAEGKEDTGWCKYARDALLAQLKDYNFDDTKNG